MDIPKNCRYTRDHFWVRLEGSEAVIGLTDYLQEELGEVVFLDLPDLEDMVEALGTFGVVESARTISDLNAPVTGEVVGVNDDLAENPDLVNDEPYGEGWLVRVEIDDPDQVSMLMTPEEYEDYISDLNDEEV